MISGILGFLVVILILVSVHEYGHYIVARWCGVRVLRFSIGFGKVLLSKRASNGTEFCIASIPLGGYVKFLDTREINSVEALQNLTEEEKASAFDLQNVWKRIAIVFAGPLINLLLALVLFSCMSYGSQTVVLPVLGAIKETTTVYQLGMREGDKITQINGEKVTGWNDLYLNLVKNSMHQQTAEVSYLNTDGVHVDVTLPLDVSMAGSGEEFSWESYGLQPWQPPIMPIIAQLRQGNGVDNSALKEQDLIIAINDKEVDTWQQLVDEVKVLPNEKVWLQVQRVGAIQDVEVKLGSRIVDGQVIGFLGVQVALPPQEAWSDATIEVNRGVLEAIGAGFNKTLQVMNLIVSSIIGMVTGGLGLDSLGGPITIAKHAGQSAQLGLSAFVTFLAFLSISLGILNLLPIPLLDGGHLVLYFWEVITGKTPSDQLQLLFQRVGFSIVIALTLVAIFNDLLRL